MSRAPIVLLSFSLGLSLSLGCDKKADSARSSSPAPATAPATDPSTKQATGGLGGVIIGTLAVSDGVPQSAIKGAAISVAEHPELVGTSDEGGVYRLEAVSPGTVVIYALSADGAALNLTAGTAAFGNKSADVIVRNGETTDLGTTSMKPTGGASGKVSILNNSNSLPVLGADIFVPGTSFIAKAAEDGSFNLTGLPEGSYAINILKSGFAVAKVEDVKVVAAETTIIGDITLSLSNGPEGRIAVSGDVQATISGQLKEVSTTRAVTMALTYDHEAALMKISDEPSFLNKEWVAVTKTATWTFLSDGAKTLYVTYADTNGLESSPYSADVIIDTEAPTLTGLTVLYGWAQTNATTVPFDVDASDTGTGIAEIQFSSTVPTLGSVDYTAFHAHMPAVTLAPGSGTRTVYARVRDYAGHVSTIESDSIGLSTETIISNLNYTSPIHLTTAYNPYLVSEDVTIASDVTIDADVVIRITNTKTLSIKGTLLANGTSGHPVTFSTESTSSEPCNTTQMPKLKLNGGVPGVSDKNRLSYANFQYLDVYFNGGIVDHATFDSTTCADWGGEVTKTGRDGLLIKNSTFAHWGATRVTEGDAMTTLDGNHGNAGVFYWQSGGTRNTVIVNNDVTRFGNQYDAFVIIEAGDLTFGAGNTLRAPGRTMFAFDTPADSKVARANVVGCATLLYVKQDMTATLEDSTVTECEVLAKQQSTTTLAVLRYNTINFTKAINNGGAYGNMAVTATNNNLTCDNVSGYCDFLWLSPQGNVANMTLTMSSNNITCDADAMAPHYGCRGFVVSAQSAGAVGSQVTGNVSLTIADNYWVGKTFSTTFAAAPVYTDHSGNVAATTNDAAAVRAFEFGDGLSDWVVLNWTSPVAMQRATIWSNADVGPRP